MSIPVSENKEILHIHLYKIFLLGYIFFGSLALLFTVIMYSYSKYFLLFLVSISLISFIIGLGLKGASRKMYFDIVSFLNLLLLMVFCVGCFFFDLYGMIWIFVFTIILYYIYDAFYSFKTNFLNVDNQLKNCFSINGFDYMLKEEFRRNYKFKHSSFQKYLFIIFGFIGFFGGLFGTSLPFIANIIFKVSNDNSSIDFFILFICLIGILLMISFFNSLLVYYYSFLKISRSWKSFIE